MPPRIANAASWSISSGANTSVRIETTTATAMTQTPMARKARIPGLGVVASTTSAAVCASAAITSAFGGFAQILDR